MRFTVSVSVKIIPLLHPFYFQKFSLKSINNFVKPLGTWLSSLTILSLLCVGCGGGSASVPANNGGVTPVIVAPPVGTISLQAGSLGGPGNINGVGAAARFGGASIYGAPYLLAGNGHGDVYTSDDGTSVRKISAAGVVTTLAGINGISGAADGLGSAARFEGIYGIAADSVGNVYVLDNSTTVRKISITGMVTTLAGKYGVLGVVDGVGSAARFNGMHDIATDPAGNVYIRTGGENAPIRKISPAGVVTTLEGGFNSAQFAVDAIGNIYSNYGCFIEKRTPVGAITTLAGIPQFCHDTEIQMDGIGSAAIFSSINGIAVDAQSNVFITDLNTVRKITAAGAVSTVAGKPGGQAMLILGVSAQ